jgi:hypothetical protein
MSYAPSDFYWNHIATVILFNIQSVISELSASWLTESSQQSQWRDCDDAKSVITVDVRIADS